MLCQRCKTKESTGFLIHLCDECFDEFEKEVQAGKEIDIEPIDLACRTQSGGGLIPDDAKGIKIHGICNDVRIEVIK